MKQSTTPRRFPRRALALATAAACTAMAGVMALGAGAAYAQDKPEEKPDPVDTRITIEAGAAGVSGDSSDRGFWGMYNGMRNQDAYGIADFEYSRRDSSTGTWLDIVGNNLGLQTRDIGLEWTRQGDWRLGANYGELRVVDPYTVNTGVQGFGTTTPTSNYLIGGAGSGGDTDLATKRKAFSLVGSKWLGSEFQIEGNVTTEKKSGAQIFGIGNVCPSTVSAGCTFTPGATAGFGILYMPMPIDYDHTQVEARVNYIGSSLQLSGGYYGSFFSSGYGSMTPGIPGMLNNAVGQGLPVGAGVQQYLGQTVALAPDSQMNHFDLTGSYVFSPMIRANFKVAYSQATQDQDFASMGLPAARTGASNLDGRVDTTLAQVRVVANPMDKLSIVAEYRYTDTDDKTPIAEFNQANALVYTNQTTSRDTSTAKLEASYRMPWAVVGSAGVGYTSIDRSYTGTASYTGISALRTETEETSWWIQFRRSLSESISGSIGYYGSTRDGSDWLAPGSNSIGLLPVSDPASQLGPNAIYMPTLADRDRTAVRLMVNWAATEELSLQFSADIGRDDYDMPSQYALQKSDFDSYSLDATYILSEDWSLNAYVSAGKQTLNQSRPNGYVLSFEDKPLSVGLGFNGKVGEKIQLGGQLAYTTTEDSYQQGLGATTTPANAALLAASGGLPDITYRNFGLKLYGTYDYSERSTIRASVQYSRISYDDWAYNYNGTPYLYSDNTTFYLDPRQAVTFFGLSYIYRWQ